MSYSEVVFRNPAGEVMATFTNVTNYVEHDGYRVTMHAHQVGGAEGEQDKTYWTGPGWTATFTP